MAAAYAALVSLLQTIHDIQRHPSPPISLDNQQVESLTHTVGFLQVFLENYVSRDTDGDEADPLEMRIADAAYAVQDVIESHIVDKFSASMEEAKRNHYLEFPEDDVSSDSDGDEADPLEMPIAADAAYAVEDVIESHMKNEETKVYELDLQQVMVEMDLIKKELMNRQNSVILDQSQRIVSASHVASSSFSSAAEKNDGMVCPEDVLLEVKEKLVRGQPDLQIIPIVGMGGIGKTTLAKTLYCDQLITEHFDICVWTTISQQFNTREILCELLSQATNKKEEELSKINEEKLGEEFYKHLSGRRFLIVMDDLWSIDAWNAIRHFFPKNKESSRVLVTTRLLQLGSQLNNNYNLQMKFLDKVSSWDLFTTTVFGDQECCPPELEEIGNEIVSNCRGLPLSIVVVGGLLKKMEHTEGSWESTRKNLTSMVNLDNDKHCLRLLKLSYNHLPVYLRPCFLYMGVFEEDKKIRVSTIVKLWISEGFVKPKEGKSLEATGKELLKELIDRNLIITHKLGKTGNIKLCKFHDLLRDLCLNQGKKEGFFHVVGQHCPRGINSQRRVIIPRKSCKKKVRDALRSMPHARSVIGEYGDVSRCQNYCGLLKTIQLNENDWLDDWLDSLASRINLRHFVGRVRRASSLFNSMDLLWNLQTLIISSSYLRQSVIPIQFWKFSRLIRHIEIVGFKYVSLPDPRTGDGVILENLQTLKGVLNLEFGEQVVKRIPNIKKLDIEYSGVVNKGSKGGDDPYCFSSIECLSKLESLSIDCYRYKGEVACLQNNLSFPHSLKRLNLSVRRDFEWKLEVLEKIGSLALLESLILERGCFEEGKWEIGEGQFPSLKYLSLGMISGLEELAAEEGSSIIFPCLQHLRLSFLKELKEMSSEIGKIPTLQKIHMECCNELGVKCMKEIVEEQVELQGDPLPFHVEVWLNDMKLGYNKYRHLERLAGPNFELKNLQTLEVVRNLEFGEEVVKRIPNIKKLFIVYEGVVNKGSKGGDDPYCFSSIECLSKLESLYIHCYDYEGEIACLQNNLSFPHSLQKLDLSVRRDFEWKLELLEKIGSLPLLESLILERGCFEEGKWEIGEGQFPSLKYLELTRIHNLEELAAEEGSSIIFPCLENLVLYGLKELKEMSSEIGNIPTLRKIEMEYCNELGVKCMKEIVEEQVELHGDPLPFHVETRLNDMKLGYNKDFELKNLQTLEGVRNLEFGEVVKRIPNIKKLFIVYEGVVNKGSKGGDDPYCFSSIECLSKLESLYIHCYDYEGEIACLQNNLSFPHSLQKLYLSVRRDFEWKLEVLEKIGSLPLLESLILERGCFEEGKWEIGEGQFPSLKYLSLGMISGLEELAAEEGSSIIFPCLQHLRLSFLKELKEMSSEIGKIPTLQKIHMECCNELGVKCMKEIVEEQVELQGDPLPFHVEVWLNDMKLGYNKDRHLERLAGPNFELKNLQTLEVVRNLEYGEEVVKRIPNIKKLFIVYEGVVNKGSKGGDDPYCFSSIECLSKLESLYIHCFDYYDCEGEISCLQNNLSFPHSLQKLDLSVRRDFEWKLEVLEKIGSLALLESLILERGCFEEGKWEIGEGQFPSLKYLSLVELSGLEELAAEEGSSIIFPCLQHLRLYYLRELKEMSSEIGNIPTLQKIVMEYCNELGVKCMKEIVEEQVVLQGDPLPFHVLVLVYNKDRHLESLAGSNFEVESLATLPFPLARSEDI